MRRLVTEWSDLSDLPVGSVVLAKDSRYRDVWAWSKTTDTDLIDEEGYQRNEAWASVAYTADRTSADLFAGSSHILVIWDRDVAETFPPEQVD